METQDFSSLNALPVRASTATLSSRSFLPQKTSFHDSRLKMELKRNINKMDNPTSAYSIVKCANKLRQVLLTNVAGYQPRLKTFQFVNSKVIVRLST